MSAILSIDEVRDLIESDEVPLKYLSLRMGQRAFWALYFECHPHMRGQSPAVTSFDCPPGISVNLEPLFGREGYSMDVADQYYADIETGVIPKPEDKTISPEEEVQVLTDLRDFLNQANEVGALPGQQLAQPQPEPDDDPAELERVRAEALAELSIVQAQARQLTQRLEKEAARKLVQVKPQVQPFPRWAKITLSITIGLFVLLWVIVIATL